MEIRKQTPIRVNAMPSQQGNVVDFRNNKPTMQPHMIRVVGGDDSHATSIPKQDPPQKKDDRENEHRNTAERFFDTLITVSLIALFFGLPIFFIGQTLQGLMFEKALYFYFWTLVGLISWVSKSFISGSLQIRKTFLDIPLLVFFVAYLLSAYLSIDRWHSFLGSFSDPSRGVLSLAALIGVYYLIMSQFSIKRAYAMMAAFIASFNIAILWFILALLNIHFLPESWLQSIPFSIIGSTQSTVVIMGAFIPFFIALISVIQSSSVFRDNIKRSILAVLCFDIVAVLSLLFISTPVVPWLAMIVGIVFFLIFTLSKIIPLHGKWMWMPILTMMAMVIMYVMGPIGFFAPKIANLPLEISLPLQPSWDIAKQAFQESAFFGSGPGTYTFNFSLYMPQWFNNVRIAQGSGFFLEALPTIGLIGTFCLLVLLFSYVGAGLYWLSRKNDRNKILSLGLWSTSIAFLFAFATVPVTGALLFISGLLFSLAIALLMEESGIQARFKRLAFQSSPQFALVLALIFLSSLLGVAFTFAFLGRMLLADMDAAKALELTTVDTKAADIMTSAVKYMPNEGRYLTYLSQIYLMLANAEMNKASNDRNLDMLKSYIELSNSFAKTAHDRSPNDIVVQENLAQVRESTLLLVGANNDMLSQAQQEYERASALDPQNPVYYLKLGQVKKLKASSLKDEEQRSLLNESRDLFRKAIEKEPRYVSAYLNLGLVQEALNDKNAAIESFARGFNLDINGSNANDLKYNIARIIRDRGEEGDTQIAEELFKSVIEKNNKYVNAYLNLGLLYEKTNRPDDAIDMYKRGFDALQGDPSDDNHKQIQKLIDTVAMEKKNSVEEVKEDTSLESALGSDIQENEVSREKEEESTADEAAGSESVNDGDAMESMEAMESGDEAQTATDAADTEE